MRKPNFIEGSIWKSILLFSFPLLIGNCFQQLYSTVDSYVVGNYVGKYALAAVGASSPIINMLIGLFMGLAAGSGVVLSQYYGAKNEEGISKTIHTAFALTLTMAVILTLLGTFLCDYILNLISVPEDIFNQSSTYLGVYFKGIIFMMVYNMGAGILRAMGDSRKPLFFLMISSFINVVLDILFVKYLHLGIEGVAYATMTSQAVSAMLVLGVLFKMPGCQKLIIKKIRFTKYYLKRIILLGLPSAIQQSVVSFSNVIVQSYVNSFGSTVVAGYSASIRIDGFIYLPLASFSMAITTFVGQNIGAGKFDRVKKGAYVTCMMAVVVILSLSTMLYFFGENILSLFNSEADVIAVGRLFQLIVIPFYVLLPFCQITAGVLNGAGRSIITMIISVSNFVLCRQLYLAIITSFKDDLWCVFFAWPITWFTCSIMYVVYFYKGPWLRDAIKKYNTMNTISQKEAK